MNPWKVYDDLIAPIPQDVTVEAAVAGLRLAVAAFESLGSKKGEPAVASAGHVKPLPLGEAAELSTLNTLPTRP